MCQCFCNESQFEFLFFNNYFLEFLEKGKEIKENFFEF